MRKTQLFVEKHYIRTAAHWLYLDSEKQKIQVMHTHQYQLHYFAMHQTTQEMDHKRFDPLNHLSSFFVKKKGIPNQKNARRNRTSSGFSDSAHSSSVSTPTVGPPLHSCCVIIPLKQAKKIILEEFVPKRNVKVVQRKTRPFFLCCTEG